MGYAHQGALPLSGSRRKGFNRPGADSYKVGEAFRADEYTLRCYYADGTTEDFPGTRLDITANGTRIYDGYRFKEASTKNVLLRLGDYSVKATLTVRN